MRDPYEILGVSREATPDELKSAYRRKAMQYHPDRNPGDAQAEERFKEVSEAYATLRDPETRARYDRYGADAPGGFRPDTSNVDWQDIFREADINIDWDARGGMPSSGNAVFDALFGMMTGMLRNAGLFPGQTYAVTLPVSLGELHQGASKRVRVPGPCICPTCKGTGRVGSDTAAAAPGPFEVSRQTEGSADVSVCPDCGGRGVRRSGASLEVRVPAGAGSGAKLRLKGAGGPGNPAGDVLAQLELQLPESAQLVGRDVHDTLVITPAEAARGTNVDYQGMSIVVPAGTVEGAKLRFRGKGLTGNGGGDLLLTIRLDWIRGVTRVAGDWFRKLVRGGEAS